MILFLKFQGVFYNGYPETKIKRLKLLLTQANFDQIMHVKKLHDAILKKQLT